jgi:hypothetical protein
VTIKESGLLPSTRKTRPRSVSGAEGAAGAPHTSQKRDTLAIIEKAVEKTNREVLFGPRRFRSGRYRLPYAGLSLRLLVAGWGKHGKASISRF